MHVYLLYFSVETLLCRGKWLLPGYCNNQLCTWGIWQSGLNMFGRFNCPITGVQLGSTVRLKLYRLISATIKWLTGH